MLVSHDADVHQKDLHGNDPLNLALFYGNSAAVEFLRKYQQLNESFMVQ